MHVFVVFSTSWLADIVAVAVSGTYDLSREFKDPTHIALLVKYVEDTMNNTGPSRG